MSDSVVSLKLLIATRNPGKTEEVRLLLQGIRLELHTLLEFPAIGTIEENGSSYTENAIVKAASYARQTAMWALADDSGLEVNSLMGAPGVFSARYAGTEATDPQRIDLLLAQLANIENSDRTARFCSAVAIADAKGRVLNTAEGICEGTIANEPRGHNGFGYDPVFVPKGFDQTFGELRQAQKDLISHRARAMSLTRDFLILKLNQLDRASGPS